MFLCSSFLCPLWQTLRRHVSSGMLGRFWHRMTTRDTAKGVGYKIAGTRWSMRCNFWWPDTLAASVGALIYSLEVGVDNCIQHALVAIMVALFFMLYVAVVCVAVGEFQSGRSIRRGEDKGKDP